MSKIKFDEEYNMGAFLIPKGYHAELENRSKEYKDGSYLSEIIVVIKKDETDKTA